MSRRTPLRLRMQLALAAPTCGRKARAALNVVVVIWIVVVCVLMFPLFAWPLSGLVAASLIFVALTCGPILAIIWGSAVGQCLRSGECLACGYNVRGLEDDAPCPECGQTARVSQCTPPPDLREAARNRIAATLLFVTTLGFNAILTLLIVLCLYGPVQFIGIPLAFTAAFGAMTLLMCWAIGSYASRATGVDPDDARPTTAHQPPERDRPLHDIMPL